MDSAVQTSPSLRPILGMVAALARRVKTCDHFISVACSSNERNGGGQDMIVVDPVVSAEIIKSAVPCVTDKYNRNDTQRIKQRAKRAIFHNTTSNGIL
eukprot:6183556-Amphidinium_carterae.2